VPCLAGRQAGKATTSRVGDAGASPRASPTASPGAGPTDSPGAAGGGSFTTHFVTVFDAITKALLAFA
jgi:hypothetical protein